MISFYVDGLVWDFYYVIVNARNGDELQLTVRVVQILFLPNVTVTFFSCEQPKTPCFLVVPQTDEERMS